MQEASQKLLLLCQDGESEVTNMVLDGENHTMSMFNSVGVRHSCITVTTFIMVTSVTDCKQLVVPHYHIVD